MSPVGRRRFAERLARWRDPVRRRGSAPGRPKRPSPAEMGKWDELVDDGPEGSRSYAVYTPAGLRAGTAVPLVVVLHGCSQSAQDAALGTRVNALADREGFVAVYPEQSAEHNLRGCWNWFDRRHQVRGSGEPAAIARITVAVLDRRGGATLDRNRVHVMGLSAGGAMAGILAATYPDLYASVGIHSAPQYRAARSAVTALLAMKNGGPDPERQGHLAHAAMGPRMRVVPVIVVQGEADRTVWAGNGDRVVRQWLTTSALTTSALTTSALTTSALTTSGLAGGESSVLDFTRPHASRADRTPAGLAYSVRRWNDNAGRPVVEYWTVTGLGHAWSGGADAGSYTDPRGPDATEAMFDFFGRCRLDRDLPVAGQPQPVIQACVRGIALGRRIALGGRVARVGRHLRRRPDKRAGSVHQATNPRLHPGKMME